MKMTREQFLAHYGTPRHSGRYPYGSGGNAEEAPRNPTLLDEIARLKSKGMNDTEIARGLGLTTTQFRAQRSIALNQQRQDQIAMINRLRQDKAMSNVAIAKRLGISEGKVRDLSKAGAQEKADVLTTIANELERKVGPESYLDVGTGVPNRMGISDNTLKNAVAVLEEKGYVVKNVQVDQANPNNKTYVKVLAPPGTTYREIATNKQRITQVQSWSEDGGHTLLGIDPPLAIHPSRIGIAYKEDGGGEADGVMYIRPNVPDLSMGKAHYAQVRIAVGDSGSGSHYLKGMAVYKDDMPKGVDILFHTDKSNTGNKLDALKKQEDDPANPFGSAVRQLYKRDENGIRQRSLGLESALNIVNEEGQWGGSGEHKGWSNSLSSQFVSKQSPTLARSQLNMTYERRKNQFDEIMSLTNPAVRQHLLKDFSDDVDSAAVHLKAASLPRQATRVILPIKSLKDHEVYAPGFRDGEQVVLVRYPHGHISEIPELTVNNRNPEAKQMLGVSVKKNTLDAIGINSKVAARMSGADYDGDTVIVIPQRDANRIKTKPPLKELEGFDPKRDYKLSDDVPRLKEDRKQQLMGDVSNLITDMTIKGAPDHELAAAVRHSMVVIDAAKHHLDYKRSAQDHGISNLKKKYQGDARSGASTIVSRRKSTETIPDRTPQRHDPAKGKFGPIDPISGKKVYEETGVRYANGELKKIKVGKLAETDDAHTLSSGTPIEKIYADHSNKLKALANDARREMVNTDPMRYSPTAKKAYAPEVASLNHKLNEALRNRPLERQALLLTEGTLAMQKAANPDMSKKEVKKVRAMALAAARKRTGAEKSQIEITQEEWNAIQAGAISHHKLTEILRNANINVVKDLASPPQKKLMTSTKTSRARAMLASGYTQAEVADALGVSLTTLKDAI